MKRTVTFLMLLLMAGAAMAQGEFVCGDTVRDGNGNEYATVRIGALCWTKSNMRAVSYADGTPIAKAMIYNSERNNDTVSNLANFGRLYSWWSAVNVPEGDDTKPAKDTAGFVQGVCPEGWHIPTVEEMNDLRNNPEEDLHSTDFWVLPNANTNSTGFSEVPGGKFSAELNRFEGLYTNSYMWTDSATSSEWVVACNSRYFCNKASEENVRKGDGLSVRCVMVSEICSEVLTLGAIDTTEKRIRLKGSITDLAGTVENSGFVWGLSDTAITNTVNSATRGADIFSLVEGVNPCDTIWFAAFAKTSMCTKTIYGDTLWFVNCCQSCPGIPTVADHEGNVYNTVLIGNQCWTKENMRCKTSPNRYLEYHNTSDSLSHHERAYYYDNPSSTIPLKERGFFYNWPGALDTISPYDIKHSFSNRRGICPEGWHIPSDEEWTIMENFVKSQSDYGCGSNENIAKALSSKEYWKTSSYNCAVGNEPNQNNASCFSIIPAGHTLGTSFRTDSISAFFWTSTSGDGLVDGYYRYFGYYDSTIKRDHGSLKYYGFSVRCLKDSDCPEVSTIAPDECNVSDTEATLRGKATRLKGDTEDHGFVWGTSKTNMTNTLNGSNVDTIATDGTFAAKITNMPPCGDTLYYMAYVKQSLCDETVYGDTMMFIVCGRGQDAKPCLFTPTVTDHEGNVYNTVQIGTQCWMKENMRVKTSPSGGDLTLGSDTSSYVPYFYDDTVSTNTIPLKDRGYYYNWAGALDTTFTTLENVTFHKRRGICPEGWHVPSDLEWAILDNYVSSKNEYLCNGNPDNIGKALSSKEFWTSKNAGDYSEGTWGIIVDECAPSVNSETNNLTGFSAVPAGYLLLERGGFHVWHRGDYAELWSSTEGASAIVAGNRILHHAYGNFSFVGREQKRNGLSVRCLKDECVYPADSCPTVTTLGAIDTLDGKIKVKGFIDGLMYWTSSKGFVYGNTKDDINKIVISDNYNYNKNNIWAVVDDISSCDTIWYAAFAKSITCDDYVYGDTLFFKVPAPAPDTTSCGTAMDHEGNTYKTVKIGAQCWMAENMRATTSPKTGHNIPTNGRSRLSPYFYEITSPTFTLNETGVLYNWAAAMDTSFTTEAIESLDNRKGICPEGWHVPSQADWNTLISTVKSNANCNVCGTGINNIAKALASTEGWETFDTECAAGNDPASNNSTGFTTIPTGYRVESISGEGKQARFWSSTNLNTSANTVCGMMLNYNMAHVSVNSGYDKNMGLSVRCVKDQESTTTCPTVTTGAAVATADNAVKLTGTVADITGTVEANGFVYGESKSALTSTKDNEGSSDESLEATISGATPCDTIWYAAFTKTSDCDDYVYGDTLFFKVPAPAPDITSCGTVMDHEDNTYKTVKIGKQCWMAENMRATTSPKTGTAIPTNGRARVNPYSYVITSPTFTLNETGVLYNWAAAMDTSFTTEAIESLDNRKGICPEGWHVPSQADWNTLINTVKSNANCNVCGTGINNIAKALASTEGWETVDVECAAGNDPANNNSTGFTTIPTGYRVESISGEGKQARFWSSTNLSTKTETVYGMMLNYNMANVSVNSGYDKNMGLSVRCVKDQESTTTCPTVTTGVASTTADDVTKANLSGTVANITGTVEANGFAYGESKSALTSTKANEGSSDESLEATITGLTPCDTIWYAAFTKTSDCDDYVYGDTMWFKVPAPAPDITSCGKVKDHQNNEYSTVKIGNQCWMAENMRATTSPKTGHNIPTNSRSRLSPYFYEITSPTFTLNETGVLYNWAAAMDTSFTTEAIESLDNRRGICPEGWHVPSQADWNTLISTVNADADCNVCGTGINNIAKALASTEGWETFDTECAAGNDPASNNSTGFTTIPTGYRVESISGEGKQARFWSSTNLNTSAETVYCMTLNYNQPNVSVNSGYDKNLGLSVRCVKDVSTTPTVVIDEKSCSEANTVTDHEGNVYATVKIGGQCWMRENLRTTKTPSGSDIALGSERYCPNNDVNNVAEYGYLYTWTAMMNGAGSSGENPSGVQGICPSGWHVPSIREWGQLLSYLRNQDIYRCNNNSSYIAKALASTSGWNSSTEDCAVGNDQSSNNAAGFGALPAGIYCPDGSMSYPFSSGYNGFGNMVYFWSSTLRASDYGTTYSLHSMFAGVGGSDLYTSDAMSVRCLKDN